MSSKWENFEKVINKAKDACENAGETIAYHFPEVRKTIPMPKGSSGRSRSPELANMVSPKSLITVQTIGERQEQSIIQNLNADNPKLKIRKSKVTLQIFQDMLIFDQ